MGKSEKSNPFSSFGMKERKRLSMAGRQQAGMGAGCLMALVVLPVAALLAWLRRDHV